jgi:mannose-6-phosphate isomerase-like protein (cupin superfamily)
MKRLLPFILLAPVFAADPPGFVIWKAGELKGYEKKLAPKMSDKKIAAETIATYDNHLAMIAHREGDGEAEVHAKMNDIFIVESGEASLMIGGTVTNSRTTDPGETRGSGITGGDKKMIAAGDIIHIPAGVPHQMLIAKGKQITYVTFKVATP